MENRINYTFVGLFVVLLTAGLAVFAFWLEKYGIEEDFRYYRTFIEESVSGLSKDASVKYRGVDVGIVETIRINPKNSEEVELLLKVKQETPVKKDMVTRLKFYGLTGLAFIEIEGGSRESPLLISGNGEIPTIKSAQSIYTRLNESLPDIAQKLSATLAKVDTLLSERNLENINESIDNIRQISAYIKNYEDEMDTLLNRGRITEEKAISAFNKMSDAGDAVKQMASNIDASLQRGDYNLREMSSATFAHTNEMVDQLKTLIAELEEVVLSIQRSPRDLLFKQSTPKLGPGETTENE